MTCPIGTYPSPYQTCHHRRFQQWVRTGVVEQILQALASDLRKGGGIDLSECYIDGGTFIVAKKGGTRLERLSRGAKVRRSSWQYQIVLAFLLSPYTLRLLLHRIMKSPLLLMKQLSPPCFVSNEKPEQLVVGDKAYDSDPLDEKLAVKYGVEMISPHRGWRRKRLKKTQDGRPLRRYKHRWKVERLFAWLQNFRRIPLRYEYHAENFLGLVRLGCMMILLMRCL
jgi:transposase